MTRYNKTGLFLQTLYVLRLVKTWAEIVELRSVILDYIVLEKYR